MTSFFLLMSLYPDVQKRAQAEVDQVVGRDRLPTLDDQNALVYISALIKEVIRWGPVAPLGAQLLQIDHANNADGNFVTCT
jgi:cytochrome P450